MSDTIETIIAERTADVIRAEIEPLREQLAAVLRVLEHGSVPTRRLTRKETAEHFSVSERSVDKWLSDGAPHIRIGGPGGSPRMCPIEITEWLRDRTVNPPT